MSCGFDSHPFRHMQDYEAMFWLGLGGLVFAVVMGVIGAAFEENKQRGAAGAFMSLALFGFGTCAISWIKGIINFLT